MYVTSFCSYPSVVLSYCYFASWQLQKQFLLSFFESVVRQCSLKPDSRKLHSMLTVPTVYSQTN